MSYGCALGDINTLLGHNKKLSFEPSVWFSVIIPPPQETVRKKEKLHPSMHNTSVLC